MLTFPLTHPYPDIQDRYFYSTLHRDGGRWTNISTAWDDCAKAAVKWRSRSRVTRRIASGANRCNALHSREPASRSTVWPKRSLWAAKSKTRTSTDSHWRTKKILEYTVFCYGKPRDGPVDEAAIEHQTEMASWISIDCSPGYLKTSYFGPSTQWPLFACVCRGEGVKGPEVRINIA